MITLALCLVASVVVGALTARVHMSIIANLRKQIIQTNLVMGDYRRGRDAALASETAAWDSVQGMQSEIDALRLVLDATRAQRDQVVSRLKAVAEIAAGHQKPQGDQNGGQP